VFWEEMRACRGGRRRAAPLSLPSVARPGPPVTAPRPADVTLLNGLAGSPLPQPLALLSFRAVRAWPRGTCRGEGWEGSRAPYTSHRLLAHQAPAVRATTAVAAAPPARAPWAVSQLRSCQALQICSLLPVCTKRSPSQVATAFPCRYPGGSGSPASASASVHTAAQRQDYEHDEQDEEQRRNRHSQAPEQ